jgi:hypothetical protein
MVGTTKKTPLEMFNHLVQLGYIRPARVEPSRLKEPTAYINVPTMLAAVSPPIEKPQPASVVTQFEIRLSSISGGREHTSPSA